MIGKRKIQAVVRFTGIVVVANVKVRWLIIIVELCNIFVEFNERRLL